jgi:hypothetical protein
MRPVEELLEAEVVVGVLAVAVWVLADDQRTRRLAMLLGCGRDDAQPPSSSHPAAPEPPAAVAGTVPIVISVAMIGRRPGLRCPAANSSPPGSPRRSPASP